jgi:divalent metal cation (Fe/Co/Zn/Cd) transporter
MGNDQYRTAAGLAIFTILYNIAEGLVSVFFGYTDEALTLFGFGVDSFIEAVSGGGILLMIYRIRGNPESSVSGFEITALKITGYSFFILAAGLGVGAVMNVARGTKPESTFWGAVISAISIVVMLWLYLAKRRTGKKLNSDPILSDASCTLVCIYMSVVLLISSGLYELTGFAYADVLGAAGLAWFSVREGREALEKASKKSYSEGCCSGE